MPNQGRKKLWFILLSAILLFSATLPVVTLYTYAALPKLDSIRVALFIDSRGTVPTVSLSSKAGLTVGIRLPNSEKYWIEANAESKTIRASVNQHMVHVLDTADYSIARAVYESLEGAQLQPYLFSASRKGKAFYLVYAGQFSTKEEAERVKERIVGLPSIASYLPNRSVAVSGPLFWNAGTYATETEAAKRVANLSISGVLANLAIHENANGEVVYSVWLGEAVDQVQLEAVKAQTVRLIPNLLLQPVDRNVSYLIKRNDLSLAESAVEVTPHYFFNGNGQKVWITANQSNVKVLERYGRSYRGSLELSRFNGKLAVINKLPFEHYLYSVVGSELDESWPLEALKAQAVAARTYALKAGMKYQIAHISDTTYDQAYFGTNRENEQAIAAVDQTAGEVLVGKKGLIEPLYYSNSGGLTADPLEIWGNPVDYLKSVPSPDEDAQKGKLPWHRIVLPDGKSGYIRSDFVRETGEKNPAGLPYYESQGTGINIRPAPYVPSGKDDNAPVTQVNMGDRFVSIEQTVESNTFSWLRGPYGAQELLKSINSKVGQPISGLLETLEVAERGISKRVTKVQANGQELEVSYADEYRTVLNGLPSTRFDIEEMGRYTILGAEGSRSIPESAGPLYIVTAKAGYADESTASQAEEIRQTDLFIMNAYGSVRLATKEPQFRFVGLGFGHGLGMSQWGARSWAELGYDYKKILQYYYQEVSVVKE